MTERIAVASLIAAAAGVGFVWAVFTEDDAASRLNGGIDDAIMWTGDLVERVTAFFTSPADPSGYPDLPVLPDAGWGEYRRAKAARMAARRGVPS